MMYRAILNERREPVACPDVHAWAAWIDNLENCRVARTSIGGVCISTVFLGINHGFGRSGDLWFETMVFGGELNGEIDRYETWQSAVSGHEAFVMRVRQAEGLTN